MKIISWNVNGLASALKKGFLSFVNKENPDVLCMQETKGKFESLKLDEYQNYWNEAEKKGYAGTAVFTKLKPLKVIYGVGIREHDKEGRVITIEFPKFFLVNVYAPNSGRGLPRLNYRKKWDKDFLNYSKKLENKKPVILCGDLNVAHTEIDLANPKANYNKTAGYTQVETDGLENMLKAGFVDTFREFNKNPSNYTFWTYMFNARRRNIGWRIDYFLASKNLMKNIKNSYLMPEVMGSDHCPIGLILK